MEPRVKSPTEKSQDDLIALRLRWLDERIHEVRVDTRPPDGDPGAPPPGGEPIVD